MTTDTTGSSAPSRYRQVAHELRRLADAFTSLADTGLPEQLYVSLDVQPRSMTPATPAVVDAIGLALRGCTGVTTLMSDGTSYHHRVRCLDGAVQVYVYAEVPDPGISTVDGGR
jgi:hypothetical protein